MGRPTLDVLLERGVLRVGDTLELDQQVLTEKTAVTTDAIESTDHGSTFWQCEVIQRTQETGEVRYCLDDQYYGLATLANQIVNQLVDQTYHSISSPETYWSHPQFGGRTLWNLRISNISRNDQ